MIEFRTGNKSVDWVIDRCKYTDLSNEDGYNMFGEFKGFLPYRMAEDIKNYGRAHGGCQYTGLLQFQKLYENIDLHNRTIHTIGLSIGFGHYKGDANRIYLRLTEEKYDLTDEDIVALTK